MNRLELAHARARQRISAEADRLIRRAWVMAGADEGRFVTEAVAIAAAARSAVVAEVDAYLTTYLTLQGAPTRLAGLNADAYSRPVDPDVQWRRPFTQQRLRLAEGAAFPEAVRFGQHQASTMLATDLQFASRGASRDRIADADGIDGYRRVPSGSSQTCGLCIAASDQLYHVEDLMPIHDHCQCEVRPVSVARRTGLSDGEYQRLLEQTGGDTSKAALSKVRLGDLPDGDIPFRVVNHGELGPYLFDANHSPPLLNAAA